jgi:hypothetical protein
MIPNDFPVSWLGRKLQLLGPWTLQARIFFMESSANQQEN